MARAIPIIAIAAALLLAGCGNKGRLVLPDQQPQKQPAPAAKPSPQPPVPASSHDPNATR